MNKDEPLNRFLRKLPGAKFEAVGRAGDLVRACGRDRRRHRACVRVGAVRLGGILEQALPKFWE